jgi:RNA polymerase sigma factor (sigma-70 family)
LPEGHDIILLINGCVKANRDSQREFYKQFYGFAMAVCTRYCNSKDDALEVVNDSFLKVFNEIHQFKPRYDDQEASLKGWMRRIIINTSIDHFRRNSKHRLVVEIDNIDHQSVEIDAASVDKISHKEILAIVQRLSPVYKTVFNLFVIDGYKHEEIAAILGISEGTSKSNLAKAKINIQKMLKETETNYYGQKAV